jgi:P pilus assembly chaperone PapD
MGTVLQGLTRSPFMQRVKLRCAAALLIGLVACSVATAHAQVALPATRVVYAAAQKEVVVPVKNMGELPVLIQAWISDGPPEQQPEDSRAPFVLAPPVVRLDAGKDNHLRIRRIAGLAPRDQVEHLYWLNILAVPPRSANSDENVLELAVRSRYKVLYRPEGLAAPKGDRAKDTAFSVVGDGDDQRLRIANRSAYVLNLGRLVVKANGREMELENPYVPPMAHVDVVVSAGIGRPSEVLFDWIDDEGRLHPGSDTLAR